MGGSVKKVFITRDLEPGNKLVHWLQQKGFRVEGQSLIECTAVEFELSGFPEWIFFYSKNAVDFFYRAQKADHFTGLQIAAMGKGTARALVARGVAVDFIGAGQPEQVAYDFGERAAGRRVLFPRAQNSRKSIQKLLGAQIEAIDLVVYANKPKRVCIQENFDYVIFTSPMNVHAFLGLNTLADNQIVVAIGSSTRNALHEAGVTGVKTAPEPSEEGLFRAITKP